MTASRDWLFRFPAREQPLIEALFVGQVQRTTGIAVGELSAPLVCQDLAKHLWNQRRIHGPGQVVDQAVILEAMKSDPESCCRFMQAVIDREARSPEEKARAQQDTEEDKKRVAMERLPASQKQLDILLKLGVDVWPENRWEASELINANKDW